MKPSIDRLGSSRAELKVVPWIAVLFLCVLPLLIKNDFYLDALILIFLWGAFARRVEHSCGIRGDDVPRP